MSTAWIISYPAYPGATVTVSAKDHSGATLLASTSMTVDANGQATLSTTRETSWAGNLFFLCDTLPDSREFEEIDWAKATDVQNLGAGAYTITITVTDGTNPLQNAFVRATEGVNNRFGYTNASGVIVFGMDAATWAVAITKAGYSFTPTTKVVTATGSQTYAMTAVSIANPTDLTQTRCYVDCLSAAGVATNGVTITMRMVSVSGNGKAGVETELTGISGQACGNQSAVTGRAFIDVPRGTAYAFKARRELGAEEDVAGVDAATLQLPSVLGNA